MVIPTLDEAAQIGSCLAHLVWADQVLVADAGSGDATVALARAAGATVIERAGPTIAAQRNAAIAAARNEWVLALDADERVSDALRAELAATLQQPRHHAYAIRRRNFCFGQEYTRGHWGRDWVTRLFTRDRRFTDQRVHEHLEAVPDTGRLRASLEHYPYRDFEHYLEKLSRYARWGAEDLRRRGRHATLLDLSVRPLWRFVRAYFVEGCVLDGRLGFVAAALEAYPAFLKYAYLWEMEGGAAGGED